MKRDRKALLESVKKAMELQPERPLGAILGAAMNISRGQAQSNPAFAKDKELHEGLKALVPADWEVNK